MAYLNIFADPVGADAHIGPKMMDGVQRKATPHRADDSRPQQKNPTHIT